MTYQPTVEDFDEMLRLTQIVYSLADAIKSQKAQGSLPVMIVPVENLMNTYAENLGILANKVKGIEEPKEKP